MIYGSEQVEDELKSRISFALKDPVLQHYFEILCKRLKDYEYLRKYLEDREDFYRDESK